MGPSTQTCWCGIKIVHVYTMPIIFILFFGGELGCQEDAEDEGTESSWPSISYPITVHYTTQE